MSGEIITTGLALCAALAIICLMFESPFTFYFAKRKISALGIKCNNFDALKLLKDVNVLALPYNRVLTGGEFFITDLVPEGLNQPTLLAMAAGAETDAENILGRLIYDTAVHRKLRLQPSTNFKELPGRGVEATVSGSAVRVGNLNWLESLSVSISANLRTKIDQLLVKGKTVLVVATGRVARGLIALKDDADDAAKKFLGEVKLQKIESLILTSQPKKMTSWIKKNFSADHIRTNLTPEDKAREVQIFRAKGKIVAMIGTDAHDLPALDAADISFSMSFDAKVDFEISKLEDFLAAVQISKDVSKTLRRNRLIATALFAVIIFCAIIFFVGMEAFI